MSRPLPPLNWFRAFESSARHLNFTAAAEELHLTQSAVSQQIRSLEARMETTLFVRKVRGLALTDSGRRLLPYVSGAVGRLEEGLELFSQQKANQVLKIACNISFSLFWLTPRLDRFFTLYPGVDLRVVTTLWPDDSLAAEADVEIRFGSKELVGDDAELLLADVMVPVCTPAMAKNCDALEVLYQMPMIQTVGTSDSWQTWAETLHLVTPPPTSCAVDSSAIAIEMARNGHGVALIYRMFVEKFLQSGELCIPLPLSVTANTHHFIKVRDNPGKVELAKAFRDWVFTEIV